MVVGKRMRVRVSWLVVVNMIQQVACLWWLMVQVVAKHSDQMLWFKQWPLILILLGRCDFIAFRFMVAWNDG